MVKTARKPLTTVQKIECDMLRTLWESKKPISQEQFGADYDIGTQGAVNQYLTGRTPLNLEVAIKFAHALGISVGDFAPRFEAVLARVPGYKQFDHDARVARDDQELELLKSYRELQGKYREVWLGDAAKYRELQAEKIGGTTHVAPKRTAGKKNTFTKAGKQRKGIENARPTKETSS